MKQLYNEGRVVGFSAYEMYIRQALSLDPDAVPATEKEWLSSMLAYGASMLLKIGTDSIQGPHYIEVEFPSDSMLCAANNILAAPFLGKGITSSQQASYTGWCSGISDYGTLIHNTSGDSPSNDGSTIPPTSVNTGLTSDEISQLSQYSKISDGIVIQPGTWSLNDSEVPYKALTPDMSKVPKLRILIEDKVETSFYLLLTGFTDKAVVVGTTGLSSELPSPSPQNGDYLGPAIFPWSAKIIFSIPPAYMTYISSHSYKRELQSGTESVAVTSDPIIDLAQNHTSGQSDYYSVGSPSLLNGTINSISNTTDGISVLATYMFNSVVAGTTIKLPPSLYCVKSNSTGNVKYEPIAVTAPYSVQIYYGDGSDAKAELLKSNAVGAVPMSRDDEYVLYQYSDDSTFPKPPISDDNTINLQSLKMSNLPYLWMFHHSSTTASDYDNVTAVVINKLLHGIFDDKFISDYCLSYNTVKALYDARTSTPTYPITGIGCLNLESTVLYSMYESIPIGERNQYNYFLLGGYYHNEYVSQQYFFVPVHKDTNLISIVLATGTSHIERDSNVAFKFNTDNKLNYLGSWFNGNITSTGYCTSGLLVNHPQQIFAIPNEGIFYQPTAATPKPPNGYDFLSWFKTSPITDMIPASRFSEYGIDDSYKNLTIYEFLQACCTRDLSVDYSSNTFLPASDSNFRFTRYLFKVSTINNLRISTSAQGVNLDNDHMLNSSMQFQAVSIPSRFFYDAKVELTSITGSTFGEYGDLTEYYSSAKNAIWASNSQSGYHSNTSISLTDKDGIMLPRLGSSETTDIDKIVWEDLLRALNNNETLDLLGDSLRGLKLHITDSGSNYIQFSNGVRLYISNTAPTGSIPNGSIGIGW